MKRLHVLVEGETEETFVNELLYPALLEKGVSATPHSMRGNIRWSRLKRDAEMYLKTDQQALVTTFFDYYGLVNNDHDPFPGKDLVGAFDEPSKKKRVLEEAIREDLEKSIGDRFDAWRRFIPYVQMYEFEALLFSDCVAAAEGMYEPQIAAALTHIRAQFPTPEHINDSRTTAPSKRIAGILPAYSKIYQGNLAVAAIGFTVLRAACPLFGEWVTRLEGLP